MRAGQASAANPAHYSPGQSFQVIFFDLSLFGLCWRFAASVVEYCSSRSTVAGQSSALHSELRVAVQ